MALASSSGGSAAAGRAAAGRSRAAPGRPPPEVRARFVADLGFELDAFQRRALDALDAGSSVVVAAPTGSGKTAVAHYAVELALAEGGKAFYTTPLKALSNQKYGELVRRHGAPQVGLLTGDNAINGDAPVVVMTTEVLRNMIYAASPALTGLRYVILDEVHYLQNAYRGPVWEEVIIHAPPEVDLVCLSATVSNAEELADWIRTVRGDTAAIIEDRRPVELHDLYLLGDRSSDRLLMVPTLVDARPNPEASALAAKGGRPPRGSPGQAAGGRSRAGGKTREHGRARLYTPRRSEVTGLLWDEGMLPAIYFIFSRAACDDAVTQCAREGARLTTSDERRQIRAIAGSKVERLTAEDLSALDYGAWLGALESGYAAHHAGLVPPFKEAVEACFAAGLVKVVFATETLSLGINMPARTVVIENLTKWSGERHEFLTPGEYTQLTGRAGRRGIDSVGYAVVLWSPWVTFDQVASLVGARSYALTSSFRPTYNMAANLVRRYPPDIAHHLLNLSFAQYRSDSDLVHLEAQLERATTALADARAAARCERGDVDEYRRLVRTRDEFSPPRPAVAAQVAAALDRVRPGDVVEIPGGRRGGRVVVISTSRRKGGDIRVRAVTTSRRLVSLGPHDFAAPPRPVTRVALPAPYEPHSPAFVRGAALALRRAEAPGQQPDGAGKRRWRGEVAASHARAAAMHPVARCPDAQHHVRARDRADRLLRETERLRGLAKSRSESLARQFDRVLQLLEEWGYVHGWALTEPGERLARLYHECDLLVAECMERGLLDGLGPAELAALVSAFTYEARGSGDPSGGFPTPEVRRRWLDVERAAAAINSDEHATSLPLTRPPDPGFMRLAHAWASGGHLADVIDEEGISAGDFVRNVKQLMDLLSQLAELAPDRATAGAARVAGDRLFRGVIAASAVVEGSPTGPAARP